MDYVEVNDETIEFWKNHVDACLLFLSRYKYLIDSFVLDFFSEDLWNSVPLSWQRSLESLAPHQLACFLKTTEDKTLQQNTGEVLPLGLLALRATVKALSLPRSAVSSPEPFLDYLDAKAPTPQSKHLAASEEHLNPVDLPHDQNANASSEASTVLKDVNPPLRKGKLSLDKKDCNTRQKSLTEPAWPLDDPRSVFWHDFQQEITPKGGQHSLLSHVFRRHMKPKKQHEVARLALVISLAKARTATDVTADIGSGCGHLARLLAYGYKNKVVCVDKEENFVKGARQFDIQLERSVRRSNCLSVPPGPRHSSCLLQPDMSPNHLTEEILSKWTDDEQNKYLNNHSQHNSNLVGHQKNRNSSYENESTNSDCKQNRQLQTRLRDGGPSQSYPFDEAVGNISTEKQCILSSEEHTNRTRSPSTFGLSGLHACGDLSATILRSFVATQQCRYVASVACCYMKLTTALDQASTCFGYPLSCHVERSAASCRMPLSYTARELACHAMESYSDRLCQDIHKLKVHCYRATLETILVKHWPQHRRAGLRSVKHSHTLSFEEYAVAAVRSLDDGSIVLPEEDLTSLSTKAMMERWYQVVIFYSLRLLLAPVIESVLLLDRCLYLHEQGFDSILVPTFDPHLSPRNMVLVAARKKTPHS